MMTPRTSETLWSNGKWFVGPTGNKWHLINDAEYASLKARDGKFWSRLTIRRKNYLLGFTEGWKRAKE